MVWSLESKKKPAKLCRRRSWKKGLKVVFLDFKVIQELLGKSVIWVINVLRRLLSLQSEIHCDRPPSPNDFLPRDAAQWWTRMWSLASFGENLAHSTSTKTGLHPPARQEMTAGGLFCLVFPFNGQIGGVNEAYVRRIHNLFYVKMMHNGIQTFSSHFFLSS